MIAEWTTTQRTATPARAATSADTPIQVRLDGKTVRGAVDTRGEQLHLLSALAGPPHPGAATVVIARHPPTARRPGNLPPPARCWNRSTCAT